MVMYHYVQDGPGMKGLTSDEFRNQLLHLKEEYKIVSMTEALTPGNDERTCVLTFDDGLKDSVTTILPVMKELNVKGTFFVPASIIKQKKILHVQKRHLLLSKIGTEVFVEELNNRLPDALQISADPVFKADYLDDLLTCSLKWMLDFLDFDIIDPILSDVFKKYIGDEEEIFDEIYLSGDDLYLLLNEGMEIGVHGHSHRQLGEMSFKEQEHEMVSAKDILMPFVLDKPLYISYPSGSYNPLTLRLAEYYGYEAGVTILKHGNGSSTNRFELGRYDCNEVYELVK
jgi:peptidoglycan/xylan/chitin deacetylase (PgdA/CDA1 family)